MEGGFSTQVILAKAKAFVDGGRSPDMGIVIELLQTKESVQASMVPVALQKQAGEDLYMYRFKVPVGGIYRFRLSNRLSPATGRISKQPLSVQPNAPGTRLVDYAISRAAAEDGICRNHIQPLTNGHELHLGEADYLALLAHGQCACPPTTTAFTGSKGCCYKCPPFVENRGGREIGDVPANAGLGAKVALDCYGKMVQRKEGLAWPPQHFEQRGWASGELPTQESSVEAAASFPVADEPDLDALFLALDNPPGAMRRAVERKKKEEEEDALRERAKWDGGVCALSGEDGDSLQRRLLQPETSVLVKPGDKEVKDEDVVKEELEQGFLLTRRTPTVSSSDPTEKARLNSSGVGTAPGLAPAGGESLAHAVRPESSSVSAPTTGDEPWATAFQPASVHPASVHAPPSDEPLAQAVRHPESSVPSAAGGDESWLSSAVAVEVKAAETRETYVFERCHRNCVHANSEKENILFVVFDDHRTFRLPQITESSRQILCSVIPPLPSDVVREILRVLSGNRIFRLFDESDLSEPRHAAIDGSDFEPLLLPTIEESDPVLSAADADKLLQTHDAKGGKQSSRATMLQPLSSEDSEAASASSSGTAAAARVTAAETDADAIVELSEDVETSGYGNAQSFQVDYQVRFRLWRRARLVVIRAFQLVRDFFRGLFRGRRGAGGVRGQPRSTGIRWGRRSSRQSWTVDAERVECDDLSKV